MIFLGCGEVNIATPFDINVQRRADSTLIADHFLEKGYPINDETITRAGVRFIILDQGIGDKINESDIVSFDFTGFLLNDTIFDTSYEEIADSIRLAIEESITNRGDTIGTLFEESILNSFREDKAYQPFNITYSASGWTIRDLFIRGFTDGIGATFKKMGVNGKALIFIPSDLAYSTLGRFPLIDPNAVIAFELSPVEITKQ